MQSRININDIINRKHAIQNNAIQESATQKSTQIQVVSNLYEQAKKTDNIDDMIRFMRECGKSNYCSNEYIKACIEFVESSDSAELSTIFKSEVLPRVNDFELRYNMECHNEKIRDIIKEQVIKNKVTDRIISNHESIKEKYPDIEKPYDIKNIMSVYEAVQNTCSIINNFDLPPYAKLNNSIEEACYLLQKYGISYHEKRVVESIVEFFCVSLPLNDTDIKQFSKVLSENYLIEDQSSIMTIKGNNNSNILNILEKYSKRSMHDTVELLNINKMIFRSESWDICKNIDQYFKFLCLQICYGMNGNRECIIHDIIPNLFNEFEKAHMNDPEVREMAKVIYEKLDTERLIDSIQNTHIAEINTNELVNAIQVEREKFRDVLDIYYTKENLEYMKSDVLTESFNDMLTLYEFKESKFDNLISRCYKFDMFLQKEIRNWASKVGQNISNVFNKVHDKIYEESSIYEILDEDGHIDYTVSTYEYRVENVSDVHDLCTRALKWYNENELSESEYRVYYTLESDIIRFNIRSNNTILLTEDDRIIVKEMINYEDLERLAMMTYISEMINPDFNLVKQSVDFFSNNTDIGVFSSFCDACYLAGIPKDVVTEIYNSVKDIDSSFVAENSYIVDKYTDNTDIIPEVAIQSMSAIQSLLEDTKPVNKKNLAPISRKSNGSRVKASPIVSKSKPSKVVNNVRNSVNSKVSPIKDKVQGSEDKPKGLNINDFKLYIAGLKKHGKDSSTKVRSAIRDMDATVERLLKSIKGAFVSDRRESIIKGSVIPSFHKCILIAVSLAGLAWFNMPLAIIAAVGGFAVSKKLTARERALMLDDIEIELDLVEKEIQMADNRNQIKKMRQLMKMKKTLQREYQRIKYNIRIGKDIIPSTSYLPSKD